MAEDASHPSPLDRAIAKITAANPSLYARDFDATKHRAALASLTDHEFFAYLADEPEAWSGPVALGDGTMGLRIDDMTWAELVRRAKSL